MKYIISKETLRNLVEDHIRPKLLNQNISECSTYELPLNWRFEYDAEGAYYLYDPNGNSGSRIKGRTPGQFPEYFSEYLSQKRDRERFMAELILSDWIRRGFTTASIDGRRYAINAALTAVLKKAIITVIESKRKRQNKHIEIELSNELLDKTINSVEDVMHHIFHMTEDGCIDLVESKNIGCRIETTLDCESKAQEGLNRETSAILNEIWSQAKKYPLIISMQSREKYGELIDLLRAITEIEYQPESDSFRIDVGYPSPIKRLMQRFLEPIRKYTANRDYTVIDFLKEMGRYAEEARRNADTHVFYDPSNNSPLIKQMIDDALETGLIIRADLDSCFKFHIKQIRLIVAALSEAIKDNEAAAQRNDHDRVKLCLQQLLEDEREEDKSPHTDRWYPGSMVYSIAYLNRIDESIRLRVLDELINISNDFSVKARSRQQRALCILAYYLVEGEDISNSMRERIFFSAFSRTLYIAQGQLWPHLTRHAEVFKRIARDTFIKSMKINDGYAYSDPYYHFLLGAIYEDDEYLSSPHRFLIRCCTIQKGTWYLSDILDIDLSEAFSLLKRGVEELNKKNDADILFYVYSLQMLFYALANISVQKGLEEKRAELHAMIKKNAAIVSKTLITCDYYNRLFNRNYNTGNLDKCYLLSGSIRFVSTYNFREILPTFELGEMAEKYDLWLKNEHGRYRYLLMRLLAYTNFNADDEVFLHKAEYEDTDFLPYDHMGTFADFFRDKAALH